MRVRTLLLAGLAVTGISLLVRRAWPREDASTCGWGTCSAPSARLYDAVFGGPLRGLQHQVAADVVAMVAEDDVHDVLEIGPGPGILAEELATLVPSMRITGVDIDPAMVVRATRRVGDAGLDDRVSFLEGDVAALPFPDSAFDLVTSTFSVHHWASPAAGLAEIDRVLRPGGRAIVYDLPEWWGRLERQSMPLAAAAEAAGVRDPQVSVFRWPGRLPLARRLEFAAGPAPAGA